MSNEKKNGVLFPKGTWSLCVTGSNFGLKGLLIKGKEYYHPEDNCIIDENGIDLFIPTSMISHFKNMGIKIGVPEMNTKQGISIDDHLRTINLLKAQLEEQDSKNAMKTSKLPPELVDKYRKYYVCGTVEAEYGAQIAVEYADEVTVALSYSVTNLSNQRDELLESHKLDIRFLESWIDNLDVKNWYQVEVQEMKDMLSNKKQLLKNHEDGK